MTTTMIRPIHEVAADVSTSSGEWEPFGDGVAKLSLACSFGARPAPRGDLVLVSAITPTPAGEGKTTVSIGLSDGLRRRGVRVAAALRQPSLGPTLGSKGGGAGGGRSRIEPFERINLGLTGDIHAVTSAHNLLAAMVDNALQFGAPAIDSRRVSFPRVVDLDDRALRHVVTGLGGPLHGVAREGRFDITAASEVMAILCLAEGLSDLKQRLGRIVVGATHDNTPVRAADLGAVGGMAVVLRDAMRPNLAQSAEGTPVFVHGGPFGNIAHGCSSIMATRWALSRADVVVTEAGFGFDLGGEKFLDIKCRTAGVWPRAMVLVATIKALKMHGGVPQADLGKPNRDALERGADNLRHLVSVTKTTYGLTPVVAINLFPGDAEDEIAAVERVCTELGCRSARFTAYANGGEGALALADRVTEALAENKGPLTPRYAYDATAPLRAKIESVARTVYGASGVEFAPVALEDLKKAEALGLASAPVCMAKTHLSLTAEPKVGGRPTQHVLPVRSVRASAGAGFVVAMCGDIMTMPGLGKAPALLRMDLADDGSVIGVR